MPDISPDILSAVLKDAPEPKPIFGWVPQHHLKAIDTAVLMDHLIRETAREFAERVLELAHYNNPEQVVAIVKKEFGL